MATINPDINETQRRRRGFLFGSRGRPPLLATLVAIGCAASTDGGRGADASPAASQPDARDYVGKDSPVKRASMVFADASDQARFEQVHACFSKRGADWEHYPLRVIGNFITEDWCTGERPPSGCAGGNFQDRTGSRWARLGVLEYERDRPKVFGLQIAAGHRAPAGEWSVSFSGSTGGQSILGEHGHISLTKTGEPETTVFVGTEYSWEAGESRFSVPLKDDAWTVLDRVRASPTALRDEATTHWKALREQVTQALARDEVLECVWGPLPGGGLPRPCTKRVPLSAEKNAAELKRITEHTEWLAATLAADGEAMHAALLAVAPTGCI